MIYGWIFRALGAIAIAGGIWYGVDSVASAFRERKQLRYDVKELDAKRAQAEVDRDAAAQRANDLAAAAEKERELRDKLARESAATNRKIEKELTDAKSRLQAWQAGADADLARCLAQPLPRWLLDGSGAPTLIAGPADAAHAAR